MVSLTHIIIVAFCFEKAWRLTRASLLEAPFKDLYISKESLHVLSALCIYLFLVIWYAYYLLESYFMNYLLILNISKNIYLVEYL